MKLRFLIITSAVSFCVGIEDDPKVKVSGVCGGYSTGGRVVWGEGEGGVVPPSLGDIVVRTTEGTSLTYLVVQQFKMCQQCNVTNYSVNNLTLYRV